MSTITLETTVGQIVTERPSRARIFERHGIDYCCGGKISLQEACDRKKLDPQAVIQEITTHDEKTRGKQETDWSQATMGELIENIVTEHHDYLREELPRLAFLVEKVARVHGELHPELPLVHQIYQSLKTELESHMWKEEQVLFPLCRDLERAESLPEIHCGSVNNPIRVMEHEHDDAGEALSRMNQLTDGYAPPEGACNSYRAMLDGLRTLEEDMHIHVHKENSILFPKAAAVEERLKNG
jgi:regulator of cell morphogenesis and NO signaling